MAFNASNLVYNDLIAFEVRIGRIWDYSTGDNMAAIDGGTYFDALDASKILRQGDLIRVSASDGKGLYVVVNSIPTTPSVSVDKQAEVSAFV